MDNYATIRDLIGDLIGKRILEIVQHDEDYFLSTGRGFVDLMFEDGNVLRIYSLHGDEPMLALNPSEEGENETFQA